MAGHRLAELAEVAGAEVRGDGERTVLAVRSLESAGPNDLSFLTSAQYRDAARVSRAGALLVGPEDAAKLERDLLVCADPYLALAKILQAVYPPPRRAPGIHETAVLGSGCEVDPTAHVGPYVVLGDEVTVGPAAVLDAHVAVGNHSSIGAGTVLHAHVVVYDRVEIGPECIIHAGTVIGADGFGFAEEAGQRVKLPQVGGVRLGRAVEVGANSAIDRATLETTVVGDGTKIDNLVQVGHNVRIGRGCILCGQVGISGSTTIGDGVMFAGQSGAANHLEIGERALIAAQAAVLGSVAAGEKVGGSPAMPLGTWKRQAAASRRLPELVRRLAKLERRLQELEEELVGRE